MAVPSTRRTRRRKLSIATPVAQDVLQLLDSSLRLSSRLVVWMPCEALPIPNFHGDHSFIAVRSLCKATCQLV